MATILSMGQLIDRTWEHYRARFHELMNVSGWLILLALLDLVALFFYPKSSLLEAGVALSGTQTFGITLFAIVNIVIAPLFGLWLFVAITRLVRSQIENKRADTHEAMRDGLRWYLPALFVNVLIVLMLILAAAIGFVPAFLFGWLAAVIGNQAVVILSALLLIACGVAAVVFAIRWSVYYALAPMALLLDGIRGRAALTACRQLVESRFWHTLLLLLIPKLLFLIMSFIVLLIVSFAVQATLALMAGINIHTYFPLLS